MAAQATRGTPRKAHRSIPAPARGPHRRAPHRAWLLATTALLPIAAGSAMAQTMPAPGTGPTGGQVVAGQAAIARTPGRTTITQGSDRAAIDWQQFNVGSQHTVQFVQPSQGSWTLNRVTGPDPSVIAGRVQANGGVAIVNQSGMVFAQGAQVDVGALIASGANITNENFMAGRMVFDGAPRPGARVENRGTITVADRGLAALVGPGVANSGVIRARLGRVALGAAETFVLDLAGDGLIGIDVTQAVRTAPEGGAALVTNSGVIEAPGGSVLISAHAASGLVEDLVRQTGRVEAPTLGTRTGEVAIRAEGGSARVDGRVAATGGAGERGGRIAVQATGTVTVGGTARVDASGGAGGGQVLVGTTGRGRNQAMARRTVVERGAEIRADATVAGDGGMLVLNSLERTEMRGVLSARGGPQGGNGGFVEISGQGALEIAGTVDVRAPAGTNGELLLDPRNIIVSDTALPDSPTGLPAGETVTVEVTTATDAVTANANADTTWTRVATAAITGFAGTVTLDASRDIVVDSAISKADGGLTLTAGRNVTVGAAVDVNGAFTVSAGSGSIAINADTFATSVSLTAATGITQAAGTVIRHRDGMTTALPLTVTVTGTGAATLGGANGDIALQGGTTNSGALSVTSAGLLTVAGALDVNGALTLDANAITFAANASATGMTLTAASGISQTGGVISHRTSAGTALNLAASVSGTGDIALEGDNGRLRLLGGGTADGNLTVRSTNGLIVGVGQTISVNGTATLTTAAGGGAADPGIAMNGTLLAESVSLTANRNITQAVTGVMQHIAGEDTPLPLAVAVTGNGRFAALTGGNGALRLDAGSAADGDFSLTGRAIAIAGPLTAGSGARNDVTLQTTTATGGVALDGTVTARNLTIATDGAVTQTVALALGGTGPSSPNGRLTVRGGDGSATSAAGSVNLMAANGVAQLDARATGALAFTAAGDLEVLQARGEGVTLVGAALTVPTGTAEQSGVVATGTGDVRIVADSLTVPGTIAAPDGREISLRVDALDAAGGSISAGTTGLVEIGPRTDGNQVRIGGATGAGILRLAAADLGGITTGTLRIGRTTIASEATATIEAQGVNVAAALTTDAALSLFSGAGITVGADITAAAVRLETTGGDIGLGTANITANGASGRAIGLLSAGAITQGATGRLTASGGTADLFAHAASGGISLAGQGGFRLVDGGTPGGALGPRSLYAPGDVAFTTGGVLTVAATAEAAAAGATLSLTGGSILLQAPVLTAAADGIVRLTASGAGATDGSIAQTAAGIITASLLDIDAAGAVSLDLAPNQVGALGSIAFADAFGFRSAGAFTLAAPLAATGGGDADITLVADIGTLQVNSTIDAGAGTVRLEATTGSVLQGATGAAITAGRLELTAAGDALLAPVDPAERNAVAVLGTSSVGGALALATTGDLTLDGTIGAASLAVTSGGTLGIAAGAAIGTNALDLAAVGAMTVSGALAETGPGGSLTVTSGDTLHVAAGAELGFQTIRLVSPGAMTLAGTIGIDGATPVSTVRLGAGAGITQEATGRILADLLAVRATGDVDLTAGANQVRRVAATASGSFALDTAGALATANATAVPLPGDVDGSVEGVQGTSVTLSAAGLTIEPGVLGGFSAWANAADGVLTLRADRLTLNSQVAAGDPFGLPNLNGTIVVAPRTLARGVSIGADDPATLFLSQTVLSNLLARNLVIGRGEAGAGALTVAGAATPLDGVNTVRLQGGSVALDAPFTLFTANGLLTLHASSGDIVQSAGGAVYASRVALQADAGSVLLGSPGLLNSVTQVSGGVGAGKRFVFRGDGTYIIAAPGIAATGAEVDLSSPTGSILQSLGAPILADRLVVAAAFDVALDGGGATAGAADLNRVGSLSAPAAGANLTLRNADPLTVEAAGSTAPFGGRVVLEAPTLTLAGDVTANAPGGSVVLRTGPDFDAPAAGSITQSGGIIRTQEFSAAAGGDILLAGANEITRLGAGAGTLVGSAYSVVATGGGTFRLSNALPNLEVGAPVSATGGGIAIFSDGVSVAPALLGIAFLAPGGVVQFTPFTAGGSIGLGGTGGLDTTTITAEAIQRVSADRLVIGSLAPADETSAGTITLRGALDLTQPGGPLALELRSGQDIAADGFALSVGRISAYAGGNIAIGTADSRIGAVDTGLADATAGIRAGGTSVRLTSAGADFASGLFTVSAPVEVGAGGTIVLQAPDYALGAAVRTGDGAAGRIELRSPRILSLGGTLDEAGTARLTEAELGLLDTQGGTLLTAGPAIRFTGTWTLDPAQAGRLELLTTPGGTGTIIQTAGTLSAASLAITALEGFGTAQIDRAGNSLPVVEAAVLNGLSIGTDGALTVRRTTSASGTVAYRGSGITLSTAGLAAGQRTIETPGTVSLTATAGDVTGTAAGAAVAAGTLAASATAGEVRLTGGNAAGTLQASARDGVTFSDADALTARVLGAGGAGTSVAGDVTLSASALTLNDVLATGTVTLSATGGDLVQAAGARLSAGSLAAGATGSLRLDGANPDGTARNTIQDVASLSAGGDITLRNAAGLTLDVPVSVGTDRVLTLEAPTLTLAADLGAAGANGQIILRTGGFAGGVASGGDIVQTGGAISAAQVAALAGGDVTLDQGGNAIGALGGGRSAAGALLGLGVSAGGDATIRTFGFGGGTTLTIADALQVGSGGALTLRADDLSIGATLRAPAGTITLLPATTDGGIGYVLGGAAGSAMAGRITLDSTELAFLPTGTPATELRLGVLGSTGSIDILGAVDLVDGANGPRVGRLVLAGDGALTQAAGTLLDVAALSATFPNGAVLLDPGVAGNRIAALDGVTAGGAVNIRGGAGTMALRDGGAGTAVAAGTGQSVTLRADDLDIQGIVRAPGGTISILPETAGRAVTLGGVGAGTLALDAAEVARLGGGGENLAAPGALRLRVGGDGTTRSAGDILLAGDVALRDGAAVRVGTLELLAGTPGIPGGSVLQAAGRVDVGAVAGSAQGDFRLGSAGNTFAAASGISAGTLPAGGGGEVVLGSAGALAATDITAPVAVRLSAGGALTAGPVTAPTIRLGGATVTLAGLIQGSDSVTIDSAGAVTQQAGALVVTNLFTLGGGSVSLPEDNMIVELGGVVATGPVLALNTVLPLLVSGAVSATGSLSLETAQGLTVAPGGSIAVTGGPGTATLTAGGDMAFGGLLGAAGGASLSAGGALVFTGTGSIGGAGSFAAGTAMTLSGTIGTGAGFTATAGGALTTTAQVTAGGDAGLTAGGALTASGRIESTDGDVVLSGGNGVTAAGTLIAAGSLSLSATGGALTATGNLDAATTVAMSAAGALASTGAVAAGETVGLTAGGTITLGGVHAAGGSLTANAAGALVASGAIQAGGVAALTAAGGDLTQSGSVTAPTIRLAAAGSVGQAGTLLATGDASLSAGGGITNQGAITAGGAIAMTAGGGLSQTGSVQAGGAASLSAGGPVTLSGATAAGTSLDLATPASATLTGGKITAGTSVRLTAGQGMTLSGFQIDPTTILLETGGALSLSGSTLVSSESIRLSGGTIAISGGSMTTGTLDIAATGAVSLNGGRYVIGRAVAFSGPGGIVASNRVTVVPRDGVLPAVVFDSRAAGASPDPLAVVQPDIPGLQPRQQATQVRVPGAEAPGSFGPASTAGAGPIVLDVDVGRSALFLLIDGGTATGTIHSAGRLGIQGAGGAADLYGFIYDPSGSLIGGAAAARFAETTRPAPPGSLTRYRINGCVVSSINCIVPSQVISIPQAPPQQVDLRLSGGRITDPDVQIPNVAEEDY